MEQQKYNVSLKNTVTEKLQFISIFFTIMLYNSTDTFTEAGLLVIFTSRG